MNWVKIMMGAASYTVPSFRVLPNNMEEAQLMKVSPMMKVPYVMAFFRPIKVLYKSRSLPEPIGRTRHAMPCHACSLKALTEDPADGP